MDCPLHWLVKDLTGNYLVRGEPPQVVEAAHWRGRVHVVFEAAGLVDLECCPFGTGVTYVAWLDTNQLPAGPCPPRTCRWVVPADQSLYKTPPPGYQVLDLRGWPASDPLAEFRRRFATEPPEPRSLLVAVLKHDLRPWLQLHTHQVYQLFPSEPKGGLYRQLTVGREALFLAWHRLARRHPHPRPRAWLLGAWLCYLQTHYQALRCYRGRWYFRPPVVWSRWPWAQIRQGIIEVGQNVHFPTFVEYMERYDER